MVALVSKRNVASTQLMELLKVLRLEQRGIVELPRIMPQLLASSQKQMDILVLIRTW